MNSAASVGTTKIAVSNMDSYLYQPPKMRVTVWLMTGISQLG
jgi:hypothetical protein